jgi:hypothetical protein
MPERRKIEDGKPRMSEPDLFCARLQKERARVIRSAMSEALHRFREEIGTP